MKKAFTLAEIMIVLMVIGILTAILLPSARNAIPNKDVMKFKKAHNALYSAIRELVNSDKYYLDGDLGVKPDNTLIDGTHDGDEEYFCNTLADIINSKNVNCKINSNPGVDGHLDLDFGEDAGIDSKIIADNECRKRKNFENRIVAKDNISYYVANPYRVFGESVYHYQDTLSGYLSSDYFDESLTYFSEDMIGPCSESSTYNCDESHKSSRLFDNSAFTTEYVVVCIDIDDLGKGEAPFGYGIRADGKIVNGARANEWLEKSIQDKN